MSHDIAATTAKTAVGLASSYTLAILSPYQEQAAWCGGFIVMTLSIVSISFDIRRKYRDRNK